MISSNMKIMILSGAATQTCNLCRGITGGTLDSKKILIKKKTVLKF